MKAVYEKRVAPFLPTHEPEHLPEHEKQLQRARIKALLKDKNAVLIAHYYVEDEIQKLAEETGGCVADSLDMAKFGAQHPASTLVVAGVSFMGETAKILSPEKTVLMPTVSATCSLDISCQADEFKAFCDQHPDRTVVVYANTSAAVKACADWVVTSSIGLEVMQHLHEQGEKMIWAPDKYLGSYIQKKTGADMLIWDGSCIVHEEFKSSAIKDLKAKYPEAALLVHPESPADVIDLAEVVGSTKQLLQASQTLPNKQFIVATEMGIFYKMQQASPDKEFMAAPTGGHGATCRSCARCPWMAMNGLKNLADSLEFGKNEITVPEEIRKQALVALDRMVNFKVQ